MKKDLKHIIPLAVIFFVASLWFLPVQSPSLGGPATERLVSVSEDFNTYKNSYTTSTLVGRETYSCTKKIHFFDSCWTSGGKIDSETKDGDVIEFVASGYNGTSPETVARYSACLLDSETVCVDKDGKTINLTLCSEVNKENKCIY